MNRRAFTLLELTLAMLLAAFIMATALGLFGMISTSDRALSDRFNDMANMARAHAVLRHSFQSLVAAPPAPANPNPDGGLRAQATPEQGAEGENGQDAQSGAGASARESRPASRRSRTGRGDERVARTDSDRAGAGSGGASGDRSALGDDEAVPGPGSANGSGRNRAEELPKLPYMWLGPTDPARPGSVDVSVPWTLEIVLSQPPFKFMPQSDTPIRGAFEKAWNETDWALIWLPIDPPGEPVIVMDNLAEVFMAALTKDGSWTDMFEAREFKEFPRAIRVVLMATSGATSDWLFEPGVTLGPAEEQP